MFPSERGGVDGLRSFHRDKTYEETEPEKKRLKELYVS